MIKIKKICHKDYKIESEKYIMNQDMAHNEKMCGECR